MNGRGYTEESAFATATHRLEGDNSMLLVDVMAKKDVYTNGFVCLYLNPLFSLFKSSRGAWWWCGRRFQREREKHDWSVLYRGESFSQGNSPLETG
jgi:hypothetical protein